MKTKILIGYCTNKDLKFQKYYEKEMSKSAGCPVEFKAVYNTGTFGLAKAYNQIWQQYPFDESYIFVFCHHDIHFKSKNWGRTLLNLFNDNPDTDIIGIAGTEHLYKHGTWWLDITNKTNEFDLWGKVWHFNKKRRWRSDFTTPYKKCQKLQPVVTIDGCFIAFNPNTCEEFDDETFDGFHFYDTSFCIRNVLAEKKVFVTETIQVEHESVGQLSVQWEIYRQKFIEKYSGDFQVIK